MRIVLVAGFTQTPSSWDGVVAALRTEPATRDATIVTPALAVAATFAETAHAIGDDAGPGLYVGYSMGGRLALRLALDRPDVVRALVLVGATPGIHDAGERARRRADDDALADRIGTIGVDAFLDEWLAQPMFASVPAGAPGVDDRRSLTATHLAGCLRVLGTGAMEPVWDRLGELDAPALLVTGSDDAKFGAIAAAMRDRIGRGTRHVRVPGGHAVPLEQPAALAREIAAFAATLG